MAEVQSLLSLCRLLTLTGAGGCGKTRLALEVAAERLEDYPDGVWLLELASLSDPILVDQSLLNMLGVPERPGRTATETLCVYLRSRHMLLLLDNCEHLLQACAELAATLLRSCPTLTILATSREALKVEGEQPWRVPPMLHPMFERLSMQENEAATILLEYDACRLFVERARVQRPEFAPTSRNAVALVRLCQHLDGMPLALELAASRVRSLTLEEICARLDQRFYLLKGGSRTAPLRQQTLLATIEWSYDLLTVPQKRLLARLSVFAGGWTVEAVEEVVSNTGIEEQEVLELLTELVDKSLVIYEPGEAEGRYRLLETVREYASEKLAASAEETEVRRRHLEFFLAFAECAEPELHGSEQLEWLKRLDAEHANLRAALTASLHHSEMAVPGMRLAGALAWFWYRRAHWREGMEWLQTFLGRPEAQAASALRGRLFLGAGMLAWYLEDRPYSIELLEECNCTYRELNDPLGVAGSLIYQGMSLYEVKRPEEAETLLTESVALWRNTGDDWGLGMALFGLGVDLVWGLSRHEEAQTALEESIKLFRRVGDVWGVGAPLRMLSAVMEARGDLSQARSLLEQAVVAARAAEDVWRTAYFIWELAHICSELEDYETALQCDQESIRLYEQFGYTDTKIMAVSHIRMGRFYRRSGDRAQSLHHYKKGLEMARTFEPFPQVTRRTVDLSARWTVEAEQALQGVE